MQTRPPPSSSPGASSPTFKPSAGGEGLNRESLKLSLQPTTTSAGFVFPSLQQPTESTWSHQRSQWTTLILAYTRHHRIFRFDISELTCIHELFNNAAIKRCVNIPMLRAIFDYMSLTGTAEYDPKPLRDQPATGALVYWKSTDEWAQAIYTWVKDKGLTNSIMTFWELTEANEVETADFYQLHETILRKALDILSRQGKCQVFRGVGEDGDGVKFV
ncbi:BQ2448_1004 [Microbotryum intermedium]|uniref:ESCRT-II complex subunit VPS25 n=1 Tax=Microbotryum intermedium TaxID=269621 RepID=A0A238FA49_9BASI|nr:BQ2448_1004 [Microbotryum intermedium]